MYDKKTKGFTLIELMIVIAIIGILAGIAIPNFLNLKDKAIWGTARANLDVIRSTLASYAAASDTNCYPVGSLIYDQFNTLLPEANLPDQEMLAKFRDGSFLYDSLEGITFSVSVNADNRSSDLMIASPNGISPGSYEDYAR